MSMKKVLMFAIALALLATPVVWSAALDGQSAEAAPPRQDDLPVHTITVTGTGTAFGAPDIVRVGLGVEASNQDILAAMEDTNARMNAVIQALENGGVAAEDIRTENYSIYQDYSYGPSPMDTGGQPAPTYRVSIGVNVTVRNPDQVGELLAAAVSAGANMVNYLQFDINDRATLESEARSLAVTDALDRAEQLAGQLGLIVGDPVRVVEGGSDYNPRLYGGGGGMDMAASAPPISQGTLSVNMSVTITYELLPAG
jgi:uncharacterized protein